jgi:hypothetical protein
MGRLAHVELDGAALVALDRRLDLDRDCAARDLVEHDQVDAVVVGEGDERREPPVRGDDQGTRDEVLRHLALLG